MSIHHWSGLKGVHGVIYGLYTVRKGYVGVVLGWSKVDLILGISMRASPDLAGDMALQYLLVSCP